MPVSEEGEYQHLKMFGWLPGLYRMGPCRRCGQPIDGAKYSWQCQPCAELSYRELKESVAECVSESLTTRPVEIPLRVIFHNKSGIALAFEQVPSDVDQIAFVVRPA